MTRHYRFCRAKNKFRVDHLLQQIEIYLCNTVFECAHVTKRASIRLVITAAQLFLW